MLTINVIMGKTLAGKSTTITALNKLGINNIITSTTRPKRKTETDNIDYQFIDNKTYQAEKSAGNVIAPRAYHVINHKIWHYFINKQTLIQVNNADTKTQVTLILDPKGYFELKQYLNSHQSEPSLLGINLKGWYLDIPLRERMARYFQSNRSTENTKEVLRRLYDDEFNAFNAVDDANIRTANNITKMTSAMDLVGKIVFQDIKDQLEEDSNFE